MTDPPDSLSLHLDAIATELIELNPIAVAQAITLSQTISNPLERWQSYLALLALEGFEQWLQQYDTPTALRRKQATLVQPNGFDLPAASRLDLTRFQVCLVTIDSDEDEVIELPASVIDLPSQMAHFYVAVAVYEEQKQSVMRYFLRYDQLAQYRQQNRYHITSNQTYQLPTAIFETDFDDLLLYLTCLEPSAIVLPTINLAIAQGAAQKAIAPLGQWLVQPVVNAGTWLQRQINDLADDLTWHFFSPKPVGGMMSVESFTSNTNAAQRDATAFPAESFANATDDHLSAILTAIERNGIQIPQNSRAAYQDVTVGDQALRLCAVIWATVQATPEPEWSLLAILKALPYQTIPEQTRVIISETTTPIVEEILRPGSSYLVAQIIGNWNEQFTITIELSSGDRLTLPPFTFQPS